MKIDVLSILILTVLISGCVSDSTMYKDISTAQARELIQNRPDINIIDVRTAGEYANGRIEKAINLDYYSKNFREDIDRFDRNKAYLVYCATGSRSKVAMTTMKELGFVEVYNMYEGFVKW
ncbi:MAG: rhodanese-like domain-containing protein [Candidatus Aenigmatarchaeota archaeon]